MKSKKYRQAYSEQVCFDKVATQIFLLRKDRGWSQKELGRMVGMRQSRISKLEDPDNEQLSVSTLQRIAAAFDVSLNLEFEKFSQFSRKSINANQHRLTPCAFEDDDIELFSVVTVPFDLEELKRQCESNDIELIEDNDLYQCDIEANEHGEMACVR